MACVASSADVVGGSQEGVHDDCREVSGVDVYGMCMA